MYSPNIPFHMMNQIIFCTIIQLFVFFTSSVESLTGAKVKETAYSKYPFVASLQNFRHGHFCLGTFITNRHVITAGHCLAQEDPRNVWVVFGHADSEGAVSRYATEYWIMYNDWVNQSTLRETEAFQIAIIKMINGIDHSNARPIRLTNLKKQQILGKPMKIIAWRGNRNSTDIKLEKATVNILSDDDCRRNIRLISHRYVKSNDKLLCSIAEPYALLERGDGGGPLLDKSRNLMGIHIFVGPRTSSSWGNFSDEFLNSYKVNLHSNIAYQYYREFIVNVTGYN